MDCLTTVLVTTTRLFLVGMIHAEVMMLDALTHLEIVLMAMPLEAALTQKEVREIT